MGFLRFLADSARLQLLSEEDYKKLMKEMPAAFSVLYGNTGLYNNPLSSKGKHN